MPDDTRWIACASRLPERNVVVDTTIIEYGVRNVQPLKRGSGALWFTPDGAMYVYYTPTHWRQVDGVRFVTSRQPKSS